MAQYEDKLKESNWLRWYGHLKYSDYRTSNGCDDIVK